MTEYVQLKNQIVAEGQTVNIESVHFIAELIKKFNKKDQDDVRSELRQLVNNTLYSREKIAKELNISHSTLSNMLYGSTNISFERYVLLRDICERRGQK